jgi:phosphonate degradation associated HDIG domain protein
MNETIQNIHDIYNQFGNYKYDELISQNEHATQCAALAKASGASSELTIAALLHDIGHLLVLAENNGTIDFDTDDEHEALGARYLAAHFPSGVTAPIALHVAAQRFLCTADDAYFDQLSIGPVRSLEKQGGLMTHHEVMRFERSPHFSSAVELRRWDEAAKDEHIVVEPFDSYLEMMESIITSK